MRVRQSGILATVGLALVIAAIAKDLTQPLIILSVFGLFDRLIGDPVLRAITRR